MFIKKNIFKDLDIEKIVSGLGLKYKKSGNDLMVCCPYHGEKNPSMGISFTGGYKGIFRCMSGNCGVRGTIFHLISHITGKKIEDVIADYEIGFEFKKIEELKKFLKESFVPKKNDEMRFLKESVIEKFPEPDGEFLKYIYSRKLNDDTIKKFEIKKSENGYYANRIIIPVRNETGKLVSLVGRSIIKNIDKKLKVRKTKGGGAKKVLFGFDKIKKDVIMSREIVLVEGEIDSMYFQQYGIPAVALGNTEIDEEQKKILLKYVDKIFLCLDGDVNYDKKVIRGGKIAYPIKEKLKKMKENFIVEVIRLPDNKDPNDLSEREIEKIKERIK